VPSKVLYSALLLVLPKFWLVRACVLYVCIISLNYISNKSQFSIVETSSRIVIYSLFVFLLILIKYSKKRSYFILGLKRPRLSENTTILSTSDTGNEDDHDSDSGGELRTDRSLGKTVIFFLSFS